MPNVACRSWFLTRLCGFVCLRDGLRLSAITDNGLGWESSGKLDLSAEVLIMTTENV